MNPALLTPFDSVFDVRVVKSGSVWDSPITGKKRIARQLENSAGYAIFRLSILINAKYNPIKINYGKDLMKQEKPYMFKTILAKTSHIFLKEAGWYYADDWVCLAGQKSQIIDMSKKDGVDSWNVREYRVVGENTLKEIKFLQLIQFSSGPACENILSDKAVENTEIMTYPNPVQSELHFMLAEDILSTNTTYQIFDVNGKAIQKASVTSNDVNIDVQSFPQGMYFIKVYDGDKILANARFIKVE